MIVYKVVNEISKKEYFGITKNFYNRKASHKYKSKKESRNKKGGKTPFYDAIRKYGWENFSWHIIKECDIEEAKKLEIKLIKENECYNLHKGGDIGFSMKNKSKKDYDSWRLKLKKARKGKKPSLGMKHTLESKKIFSEASNMYWKKQYTYPNEIAKYKLTEAMKKFGISKTHYYRIKKRALTNE